MNKPLLISVLLTFAFPVLGFWPALFIIVLACVLLRSKDVLVLAFYISFFNMASADAAPFFGGLCGSLLAVSIYLIKIRYKIRVSSENKYLLIFGFAFITVLVSSFLFVSNGSGFEKTAVKSLIQQMVFVFIFIVLSDLNIKHKIYLSENIEKYFIRFLFFYYGVFFIVNYFSNDLSRFGGALGAQSLAFILTLIVCHYSFVERNISKSLVVFLFTIPTQSRTFLAIQILIICIIFVTKEKKVLNKILYSLSGFAAILLALIVMPLISKRLNYYDAEFFGSLLGRVGNYEQSIEMILNSPIFGNGVGSIVKVLEGWVVEFYEYYLASGDTTIMHNEYLRILTETGFFGMVIFLLFILSILKSYKGAPVAFMIVFLVGSLLENTIALYSGPIVAMAIIISSATLVKVNKSFD